MPVAWLVLLVGGIGVVLAVDVVVSVIEPVMPLLADALAASSSPTRLCAIAVVWN